MILRTLRAKGFMRYQELSLSALPSTGAVAIIGENESGKTTIGEAVSFALFGETVKTRATDISQVVSWDAEEASVSLEVDAGDKGRFLVERKADKLGLHEVRLSRIEGDAAVAVASGPSDVEHKLHEITGLTFDEFRHSLYLAQAELGLTRRADGDHDGRLVLQEIVGIAAVDRAAKAARDALSGYREKASDLAREASVKHAVAEAHKVPPGYGDELDRDAGECRATIAECEGKIPALAQKAQKLRDAESARERGAQVFERLTRAISHQRAERAAAAARRDLAAVGRGLETEAQKAKKDLAHHEKSLGEVRSRVDRLIDYQAKIAELEARLDLYKQEVKRSLDAPEIDAEDVEALESLALPATPAAGLKLSTARVERLQRFRKKAIQRAVIYGILAVLFALVGAPSVQQVRPDGGGAPENVIANVLSIAVNAISGGLSASVQTVWLAFAIAGSVLAFLFTFLLVQRIRRAGERADQLKIAGDQVERLEKDVKELEAERARLESLDLKKPLRFAEEARALKNPTVHDSFQRIREAHNDFVSSPEQRDALVSRSRADEGKHRELMQEVEARIARLLRIQRAIPTLPADGSTLEEAIPEKLEVVEARVKALAEQLEEAERDRREAERAGSEAGAPGKKPDEPIALFREVQEPFEATWKAISGDAERARFVQQTRLAKLAANPGELDSAGLRAALQREAKLFEETVPSAGKLRALRESVEEERRALEGKHITATARLAGLGPRIDEVESKRERYRKALGDARRLEEELAALRDGSQLSELTCELLEEMAQDLRRRIGPMIAKYAAAVLPRLTGGRYKRVRVSPELDLRVYSPDKNDWVPLIDLSIGAADQLMLAVRLAVGQALVLAKGLTKEKHFLFLDEPLASFDETRAKSFLEILKEHEETFPQVFIVAHLHIHGLEDEFAKVLSPRLGSRTFDSEAVPGEETPPPEAGLESSNGEEAGAATITTSESEAPDAGAGIRVGMDTTTELRSVVQGALREDHEEGMDTITELSRVVQGSRAKGPAPAAGHEHDLDDLQDAGLESEAG